MTIDGKRGCGSLVLLDKLRLDAAPPEASDALYEVAIYTGLRPGSWPASTGPMPILRAGTQEAEREVAEEA